VREAEAVLEPLEPLVEATGRRRFDDRFRFGFPGIGVNGLLADSGFVNGVTEPHPEPRGESGGIRWQFAFHTRLNERRIRP
jgi:hypothetical protein